VIVTPVTTRRYRPTDACFRQAVSQIVRNIGLTHGLTDRELGDRIGVSDKTIEKARNEKTTLGAVNLAQIGHEFGADALQPYADLFGGLLVKAEGDDGELDELEEESAGTVLELVKYRRHRCRHTLERALGERLKRLQSKITGYLARRSEKRIARRLAA
jgi:transcriptional regulator with XRE-family HTH domain